MERDLDFPTSVRLRFGQVGYTVHPILHILYAIVQGVENLERTEERKMVQSEHF